MPDYELTRVSDAERDQAISALSEHYSLGRLDLDELNHRADLVFQAKTQADVVAVLADLPATQLPTPRTVQAGKAPPASVPTPSAARWRAWALTAVICLTVWLIASISQGAPDYFWPFWVIVPWGAALATRTLGRHSAY